MINHRRQSIGPVVRPAPEVMAERAAANGCGATPVEQQVSAHVTRRHWTGCEQGAEVVFDIIAGGGHTWPGSTAVAPALEPRLGPTTGEVDATAEMWAFFEAHPRVP